MSGRTPINITANTVYHGVDDSDDQFNVFVNASLLLRGFDVFTDDAIAAAGLARVSGQTSIDDGLTLENSVTFANAGMVTQNGDNLVIGQPSSDSAIARNVAGATWDLVNGAQVTGEGSSQFVNLGALEQTSGDSTIDANFYDRGGTSAVRSRSTVRWILRRPSTAS